MKSYGRLGFGNYRVRAGVISLVIALFSGGFAQAAPQYAITCDFCHRMPPLDSATTRKNPSTGAVPGNHQGHATSAVSSCAKCHGDAVTGYTTSHRNKVIELPPLDYSRKLSGFLNQTSVPPSLLGSCSNAACHSDGKGHHKVTPAWGSASFQTPTDCVQCHDVAPATGSHPVSGSKHAAYYGTGTGSCGKCHPDHPAEMKPFAHATSAGRAVKIAFTATPNSGGTFASNQCSGLYCHSNGAGGAPNQAPTWGGSLDCKGCHNSTATSGAPMTSGKHGAHVSNAALGANYGCAECHAKTVSNDTTIADVTRHVSGFADFSGAKAGRSYSSATGICSTVYCHSDGKGNYKDMTATGWNSSATLDCKGCHGADAVPAFSSTAGEPNYANGGEGNQRANSHKNHASAGASSCDACHTGTTANGTTINTGSALHLNGSVNVTFNPAKAGAAITWSAATKTCANISCHGNASATWGGTVACLVCHSLPQGNRAAITAQFSANSHHVQGTVDNTHCYQCHWEANSDGSVNSAYHHSMTPGSPVELVVYGAGTRPAAYNAGTTAVQYTANGTRSELQKINSHCLGCHSDQNNDTRPFGDGKTPKQYAWDGTSVAARYAQSGATTWGKYPGVANAAPKNISKAFSAHGNLAANQRGWDTTNGVDGAITNTGGTVNVLCYDCHNSHGSTVAGTTTRYASATVNGGILKDTTVSRNGYSVAYKPYSAGSAATKNKRNPGASLCLDCHMNATATQTPWGYSSTYGATQQILGYWDSPYMSYSTCGPEQRYPYKKKNGINGGHFGASMTMSSTPTATIGGLCTPCHDPHGVSPTLGTDQQYAVPLLKGTWLTSPYKEDVAPRNDVSGTVRTDFGFEGAPYHIDQNTFTSGGITQTVTQSAGLCLGCHPQNSLTDGTTHTWKSKDRVHEAVMGWKTAAGTKQHSYTCSKCHSAHTSSVLPRLMVTNCLDGQHKGRSGYNPNPAITGSGNGDDTGCYGMAVYSPACSSSSSLWASGSGRIPGNYWGGDGSNSQISCHEGDTGSGTDQSWNSVTPWIDTTPVITSGPGAITGHQKVLMHMDEAVWNGTSGEVKDSSGENNNGTSSGAASVAGGISGRGGSFNSAYVPFNYMSGTPVDNFTIEAWVKPTATHQIDAEATSSTSGTSGQGYLFWPDQMGANGGAGISVGTNGISVYEHGDGYMPALAVYGGTISSTQWTHIAVVYENKRPSIYVNGALVRTGLQSTRPHVYAPHVIGGGSYGYYAGLADEIAVYDTAFSGPDILAHSQLNYSGLCNSVDAIINWTTIPNGTSYVDYGLTTAYGSTAGNDSLVTSHSVTLSNLATSATYHYRVRSRSLDGRETISGDYTFSRGACTYTALPQAPTGISATPGNAQATISWTAGAGGTSSLIRYGTATGLYGTTLDPATSPQSITGLTNGQTIYYQVGAKNTAGITWSAEYTVAAIGPPQAPTGISATAGNGQATISWTAGTGGTSSLIRYGTATGVYTTTLDPATSPQVISGLPNGQATYYQVGAKNVAGTMWSVEYSVTPVDLPQPPTGISATAGNGQATISWTAGTGATSSSIRYGTTSGSYPSQFNSVSSPRTITGLTNGTTIYYQVGAVNGSGTAWSTQYSVTPTTAAPSAVTAISATAGNGQATILWTVGAGSTSSLIRYGTVTGIYPNQLSAVSSPRTITGLANGTTIYYQVGAANGSGTTWSTQYSITPTTAAPSAATAISATPGYGQATVSWTAGTGATSSSIRYGTVSGSYPTQLNSVTSPRTLAGLGNGTPIYYQVGAANGSGTTWSAEYSVTPSAAAPSAATSILAIAGNGQVTVSWTAGTGATSSLIRYGTAPGTYTAQLSGVSSPRTITGLTNGYTIYYQVGAANGSGTTWSTESTVLPSASAPYIAFGILATPGNGQATFTWTAGNGTSSSLLKYGMAPGAYTTTIDPVVSPLTLTSLTNGTTLYYLVGGKNGSGTTWSAEYSVTPSASAPSAATGISAAPGNGQAIISWTAGTGSASSSIRYGTAPGTFPSLVSGVSSPRTITGLSNGTTVYYQIGAANGLGTTWSAEYTVIPVAPLPSAPTGITALAANGQVTISWTAGTYATSSLIQYGTVSGVYPSTIDPATSPRTITGLTNGTPIYYQVGAKNSSGTAWSSEFSVTPTASAPSVATGISATAGYGQVNISWTPGSGATSSSIRYGMASGAYTTTIDPATSPLLIANLTNGYAIYYQVGAKNASATTWSTEYSAIPTANAPSPPTAVTAAGGDGQVTISWAVGYGTTSSLIRYGTASGAYTTTIDPATSPLTITGLTNLTTIYYQIGEKNYGGTTWSTEYSGTPGAPPMPAPITADYQYYPNLYYYRYFSTNCTDTPPVTIAWNPVTSVDGDPAEYNVLLNGVWQGWQTATTLTFTATPAAGYSWYVKARDAVHPWAESATSAIVMYEWDSSCSPPSSCPLVYSWNGTKFNYETDLQGPAISQIWKPGRYVSIYQPSYIVLEGLVPDANNQYRLKIWESLQESSLIDEAKLLAVDYPDGYQIVSSGAENTYYYAYVNPFTIYTIKDSILPIAATDKNGNDILATVLAVDDNPVPLDPNDPDNFYTLDFGTIQHPENAKLVIDGWQDINSKLYMSTQTVQPYLEVVDGSGAWAKVKSFGMPMGDLKTMVIDIANIFLSSDQRIRVHMGIKKAQVWVFDRIRLDDSAPVSVTVQELPASSADLQLGGQAIQSMVTLQHRLVASSDPLPVKPDYFGYGSFTRYGEVGELLSQRDDKYVIMNYADKLELTYPAPAPPQAGMKRGFIFKVDNYYKDFKDYKYVEPLPFHAMSDYPPPPPQAYPTDADHQLYRLNYNTRLLPGPANPTLTPQPSPTYAVGGSAGITFQWSGVSAPDGDSAEYLVEVSSASNMATISYVSTWQTGTNWAQTLPAGTWYWRVTARDIVHPTLVFVSATGSFTVVDRTPAAPTLVHQPDSTSSGDNVSTTLQWNPVSCADGDPSEYYVEIDNAATFDSGNRQSSGWISGTGWTVPVGLIPAGTSTTWYWRVTARDSIHVGAVSAPSASDNFQIVYTVP